MTYNYQTNPAEYVPYSRRTLNDPDPQRNPEWFTTQDLKREVQMLLNMNRRYGTHPLRVAAYLRLDQIIRERAVV